MAGRTPRLVTYPTKPEGRFVKSADVTKLRAVLPGFRPSVDLAEGIARMIDWHGRSFGAAASSGVGR